MAADKPNNAQGKNTGKTVGNTKRKTSATQTSAKQVGRRKVGKRRQRIVLAYGVLSATTLVLLLAVGLLAGGILQPETARETEDALSWEPEYAPLAPQADPAAEPELEPKVELAPESGLEPGLEPAPESKAVPDSATAMLPREIAGRLYFVIDDAGYSMKQLEPFLEFPGALTIAVLPQLAFSTSAALAALRAGKEVILHQPMEAESDKDPGPGAIYVGDSAEEIRAVLAGNLATVPGAIGMNNHMGSRATSDRATMEPVLLDVAERNLYFLDSRTAVSTVVAETARSLGLSILERNVFLDNNPDRDSIDAAIREGMELASRRGHAVMIGHVMVTELAEALHDLYPEMMEEGYELLPLSQLLSNGRDDALPAHAHPRN